MYPYDDEFESDEDIAPTPITPEPISQSEAGEYRMIHPDAGRSWRDADYTPENEATVPAHFYDPGDRPPKEKKPKEPSHNGHPSFMKVACLCLCCALIGGLAGGAATAGIISGTAKAAETEPPVLAAAQTPNAPIADRLASGYMSANDIYELGCKQVVGISTEITTTNIFGMTSSGSVSGSGFVITKDGYIMTNFHVVEDAYRGGYDVNVMLYTGEKYTASIVGFDKDNDVAVLKIDASNLSPVTLGNSDSISVGDTVFAIGNPLGELAYTMTSGIVSATGRVISTDESTSVKMFQFDAAVNPGNSGGPVYDGNGQVVGVVTAKYSQSGVEGIGFAIPIADALSIANELISNGYVSGKPYMGVAAETITVGTAQYYNMAQGAYLITIDEGGPAEAAGLKIGDIITELDGSTIATWDDLKIAVKSHRAGDTVSLTFWRSGEYMTASLTFAEAVPQPAGTGSDVPAAPEPTFPFAS
ncbi:MAG: trypsin-like peptidase domain-containing protein [Oscillospiraceae bacterium]